MIVAGGGRAVYWKFSERQEEYFAGILGRKWGCDIPGHAICVPTVDGQHRQISEEGFAGWVKALCQGEATTAQPPTDIFGSASSGDSTTTINRSSGFQAVSIAPSRRRSTRSLVFPSPRESTNVSSFNSLSSWASSGAPGPGYYTGKALKWLGVKSLSALEELIIMQRTYAHLTRLKQLKISNGEIEAEKQKEILEIIGDALEMSKTCYSVRVNTFATLLGRRVTAWVNSYSARFLKKETNSWLVHVHACLAPLALARMQSDAPTADLVWELLEALTRVPLELHGPETTSAVIRILSRELAFSPYTLRQPWLGDTLIAIVGKSLQLRPLSADELDAIRDMAVRRMEQDTDTSLRFSRPWELVIFTECASQDPWFREVVTGVKGVQDLVRALEVPAWKPIAVFNGHEECVNVNGILHALIVLSRHVWVVDVLEQRLMIMLLAIIRRRKISQSWRFHATTIIRNIVSHRPEMLHVLVQGDPVFVLERFAPFLTPEESEKTPEREDDHPWNSLYYHEMDE